MFTWIPIQREATRRILDHSNNQGELLAILAEMKRRQLKVINLQDKTIDGRSGLLSEIDPFTFLASFNRGVTDRNRRDNWGFLKEHWGLEASVPDDFAGIPTLHPMRSRLMPWEKDRHKDHVTLLWQVAAQGADDGVEGIESNLFDRCVNLDLVGIASLTIGLFWMNPRKLLATDSKNVAYGRGNGITTEPTDYRSYRQSSYAHVRTCSRCSSSEDERRQIVSRLAERVDNESKATEGRRNGWLVSVIIAGKPYLTDTSLDGGGGGPGPPTPPTGPHGLASRAGNAVSPVVCRAWMAGVQIGQVDADALWRLYMTGNRLFGSRQNCLRTQTSCTVMGLASTGRTPPRRIANSKPSTLPDGQIVGRFCAQGRRRVISPGRPEPWSSGFRLRRSWLRPPGCSQTLSVCKRGSSPVTSLRIGIVATVGFWLNPASVDLTPK
jgi:hypothetical protein